MRLAVMPTISSPIFIVGRYSNNIGIFANYKYPLSLTLSRRERG
jgi:hypothetical protein